MDYDQTFPAERKHVASHPGAGPRSLFDGLDANVASALGVRSLRHRSALQRLVAAEREGVIPSGAVQTAYQTIAANWMLARAAGQGAASRENWRWRVPQLYIAEHNRSPEVVLERAIVRACNATGRDDWANQVPVASGIVRASAERRRAIDLVRQHGPLDFAFVELKIASDNPLYAAFEIVAYLCVWLLSRSGGLTRSPLLDASRVRAQVLAPRAYYALHGLSRLESQLDTELGALGASHGVTLGFAYQALPTWFARSEGYSDAVALALIDGQEAL